MTIPRDDNSPDIAGFKRLIDPGQRIPLSNEIVQHHDDVAALRDLSAEPMEVGTRFDGDVVESMIRSIGSVGNKLDRDLARLLRGTTFEVAPDDRFTHGADAMFDARSNKILVPLSLARDLTDNATAQAEHRTDHAASLAEPWGQSYRDVATAVSLLAHEAEHDAQPRDLTPIDYDGNHRISTRSYLRTYELEPIRRQEQLQFELGATPRAGTWLTLDRHGDDLPDRDALDNIVTAYGDEYAQHRKAEHPGRKFFGPEHPGRKFFGPEHPGRKFFGPEHPGRKFFGPEND